MFDLKVDGIEMLSDKLEEMFDEDKGRLIEVQKIALEKSAEIVEKEARSNTEWKDNSGTLRPTIEKSNVKKKKGNRFIYVGVGGGEKELEYGWMLEYGTSKMHKRPYLHPALEKKADEAKEIMIDELKRGLGL